MLNMKTPKNFIINLRKKIFCNKCDYNDYKILESIRKYVEGESELDDMYEDLLIYGSRHDDYTKVVENAYDLILIIHEHDMGYRTEEDVRYWAEEIHQKYS